MKGEIIMAETANLCIGTVADYIARLEKMGKPGKTKTDKGVTGTLYTTPYIDFKGKTVGRIEKIVSKDGKDDFQVIRIGKEECSDLKGDGILDVCYRTLNDGTKEERYALSF